MVGSGSGQKILDPAPQSLGYHYQLYSLFTIYSKAVLNPNFRIAVNNPTKMCGLGCTKFFNVGKINSPSFRPPPHSVWFYIRDFIKEGTNIETIVGK